MKKVFIIFGTRPEAIKMCPVIIELKKQSKLYKTVVCVTGQHEQMLDQVLGFFGIRPDYSMHIMRNSQTLFDITSSILINIRNILDSEKPDLVLVHGDTTTSFVAALASFYMQIPVGHVEAGLRTKNIYSPFPEEFNRQAISIIASIHFSPTEQARRNLISEGKCPQNIHVTGNTSIDALNMIVKSDFTHPILEWVGNSRLILITAHRRENIGIPMNNMFKAIKRVISENENVKAVFPVHLNPAVRNIAEEYFGKDDRIRLIEPLDVFDFQNIMARSYLVLTDSGGIQEEAPSLGKPVLVMRDTTERPEGVEAGTLRLVGTSESEIYSVFTKLLKDSSEYRLMAGKVNPYGDGFASLRIVREIDIFLQNRYNS